MFRFSNGNCIGSLRIGKRCCAVLCIPLALTICTAIASAEDVERIVVTAPARERGALQPRFELDFAQIAERTPTALTDILQGLPGIGIRTNSRGEAVLRLRGSEERQTGLFLDGAPLSVPWDGRVDLSALPAGIVEQVRVTASAAPVEYGSNSVLGVVDIRSPIALEPGLHSLQAEFGTEESGSASAVAGATTGDVNWVLGLGYRRIGGEAVASRPVIPFGPVVDGMRDNTDLKSGTLFVGADTEFEHGALRVSLLSVGAERGIANAGHIDPALGSPRYWRYPDWHFNQLTANSSLDIGARSQLRFVLWLQRFEQTIDQYADDTYSTLDSTEFDDDDTVGMRFVLEQGLDWADFRLAGNAQVTQHEQIDVDHTSNTQDPLQRFQQHLFSLGAEVDKDVSDSFSMSAAVSYDVASTPETGGRDKQETLSEWAASMAVRWNPADRWEVAATIGQRTRFPTLRELYGESLGLFLINPDLRPETATLGDITLSYLPGSDARLQLTPWVLHIDDTLSRRIVDVNGERLRQRYNLVGSDGYGVEAIMDWSFSAKSSGHLNLTWQDLEARREPDGTRPVLYQRPGFQASLAFDWEITDNWDLYAEARHVRNALDEEEDGTVVELPASTALDMRLFRRLSGNDAGEWRVYVAVDNLTDGVELPQLGLPMPGRTMSAGVSFFRD